MKHKHEHLAYSILIILVVLLTGMFLIHYGKI